MKKRDQKQKKRMMRKEREADQIKKKVSNSEQKVVPHPKTIRQKRDGSRHRQRRKREKKDR